MTIRNFLQNYIIGILITGAVYGVIYTITEGLENALTAKDFLGMLWFPIGLGLFALIFSLPYLIIMFVAVIGEGQKDEPNWEVIRGLHILLSLGTMLVAYLLSDAHGEGLRIVGLILGYAITGSILIYFPIKTLYLTKNKNQKE